MNYKKIYQRLIDRAKLRQILEGYKERHHIIPKCIGGSNNQENIVELTAEEHYVAHLLLARIYGGICWLAVREMSRKLHKRNNKEYGWIRKKVNKELPIVVMNGWARKHGFKNYLDQCIFCWKLYEQYDGDVIKMLQLVKLSSTTVHKSLKYYANQNDLYDYYIQLRKHNLTRVNRKKRLSFTRTQQKTWREGQKNSRRNYDHFDRMRKERIGSGNPNFGRRYAYDTVTCPFCGKNGGRTGMKRWHFDNCKGKV